jgi:hypothetical protein
MVKTKQTALDFLNGLRQTGATQPGRRLKRLFVVEKLLDIGLVALRQFLEKLHHPV